MPGFVVPVKVSGSSQPENVDKGSNKFTKSPFESCLRALENFSDSQLSHFSDAKKLSQDYLSSEAEKQTMNSEMEKVSSDQNNIKENKENNEPTCTKKEIQSKKQINSSSHKNSKDKNKNKSTNKGSNKKDNMENVNDKKHNRDKKLGNISKGTPDNSQKIQQITFSSHEFYPSQPLTSLSQDIPCSQSTGFSSVFTKMILSQPPKQYNHKQRMEWLQERRQVGIWVQCNKPDCEKWRYLPHIHDPTVLPKDWFCYMNPDGRANDCKLKEQKLKLREEEDTIHGEYTAGSLVWAHLQGYPWWPAIVDDDPDTEQFYWLDGFSDIPTYYHVTFIDSEQVTRSWITPKSLKPFAVQGQHINRVKNNKVNTSLQARLKYSISKAEEAIHLSTLERLKKYSFIACYKGLINSPKGDKIKRHQKRHIEVYSSSESDDSSSDESLIINKKATKRNKPSIAKMLETQISNASTFVSLEDLIQFDEDYEKRIDDEVKSTSSKDSNQSSEIPMQSNIIITNFGTNAVQETQNLLSVVESTEQQETQDVEKDAVVPSTEFDVINMTDMSITQSINNF